MFAVIETGEKQYKVQPGTEFTVEKLNGSPGSEVVFSNVVLLFDDNGRSTIGTPFVDGVSVVCSMKEQKRAKKVIIFKKRRRKNSRRKTGHRQQVTVLEVKEIRKS